jgi:predicted Zn-dependent peptidase
MSIKAVSRWMHFICRVAFGVAMLGLVSTTQAANGAVKTPAFERVALSNGAVLLLMERHDVPLISFDARVLGGARLDAKDRLGTANLLASMFEKGAGSRDALSFAQAVAAVGGNVQTSAATEALAISGSFLSRDRQLMVELLADMLQRPRLDETELQSLRARHIEFIRAAKDSDLSALSSIYGAAALFEGHPYGNPVFGSEASLARIQLADLRGFYEQQVGADRLIISVAGDFKSAEMKRLLSNAFSKWRKAASSLPSVAAPTPLERRRVVLVDAPDSVQSYFWMGNVAVSRSDPRRAALDIVNTLFGGRFTSMLNTELRIRSGLSYGASSSFDRLAQSGHWEMSSFTRTETTIEAIDLAFATLNNLRNNGLDAAALNSSKQYVLGQFPLGLETAGQWASQLATLEQYQLGASYIDEYAAALRGVELADTKMAITQVFPKSDTVLLVVIGKATTLREALSKFGPITELKLSNQEWTQIAAR